ncbi:hypothetical protein H9P43_004176 [Blastocladiella emersonii ATCC 22665]|nr:hypothetical protein H9P43_004176 [Blastocladiella emersonii ATCC 22665]
MTDAIRSPSASSSGSSSASSARSSPAAPAMHAQLPASGGSGGAADADAEMDEAHRDNDNDHAAADRPAADPDADEDEPPIQRPAKRSRKAAGSGGSNNNEDGSGSGNGNGGSGTTEAKQRKARISQACVICRKKKIKCNGAKPSCGYCSESGFPCMYTAPKRRGPPRKMPSLDELELEGVEGAIPASVTVAVSTPKPAAAGAGPTAAAAGAVPPTAANGALPHHHASAAAGNRHYTAAAASRTASAPMAVPSIPGPPVELDCFRLPTDPEMDRVATTMLHITNIEDGDVQHLRNVGPSHGIHLLRDDFPDFFKFGSLVTDHPKVVPVSSVVPADPAAVDAVVYTDLPSPEEQEFLIRFYFDEIQPLFPIMEAPQLNFYRNNITERNFHFEVHAMFAMAATWYVRRGLPRPAWFTPPAIHVARAKLLLPRVFTFAPSLSRSCGLLMLAMALAGDAAGSSYALAGAAIRIAQDVGLHVDLGRLPIADRFKPEQTHRANRVWWCCYVVDRMLGITLGRPLAIHEDEFAVPMLDANPDAPQSDRDYAVLVRLAQIQGRLSHAINSIRFPTPAHLSTLSSALEAWLAALPQHLRFSFQTRSAESPFALSLNLMYYYSVLVLYRPFLVPGHAGASPTAGGPTALQHVTSICLTTVKAMLFILAVARDQGRLHSLGYTVVHGVNVMASALYLAWCNALLVHVPMEDLVEFLARTVDFAVELEREWPASRASVPLLRAVLARVRSEPPPMPPHPAATAAAAAAAPTMQPQPQQYQAQSQSQSSSQQPTPMVQPQVLSHPHVHAMAGVPATSSMGMPMQQQPHQHHLAQQQPQPPQPQDAMLNRTILDQLVQQRQQQLNSPPAGYAAAAAAGSTDAASAAAAAMVAGFPYNFDQEILRNFASLTSGQPPPQPQQSQQAQQQQKQGDGRGGGPGFFSPAGPMTLHLASPPPPPPGTQQAQQSPFAFPMQPPPPQPAQSQQPPQVQYGFHPVRENSQSSQHHQHPQFVVPAAYQSPQPPPPPQPVQLHHSGLRAVFGGGGAASQPTTGDSPFASAASPQQQQHFMPPANSNEPSASSASASAAAQQFTDLIHVATAAAAAANPASPGAAGQGTPPAPHAQLQMVRQQHSGAASPSTTSASEGRTPPLVATRVPTLLAATVDPSLAFARTAAAVAAGMGIAIGGVAVAGPTGGSSGGALADAIASPVQHAVGASGTPVASPTQFMDAAAAAAFLGEPRPGRTPSEHHDQQQPQQPPATAPGSAGSAFGQSDHALWSQMQLPPDFWTT